MSMSMQSNSEAVEDEPGRSGVRVYRGRKISDVLPTIRAELGADAVILRHREGVGGGVGGFFAQRFIEVEAMPGAPRVDMYDDAPADSLEDLFRVPSAPEVQELETEEPAHRIRAGSGTGRRPAGVPRASRGRGGGGPVRRTGPAPGGGRAGAEGGGPAPGGDGHPDRQRKRVGERRRARPARDEDGDPRRPRAALARQRRRRRLRGDRGRLRGSGDTGAGRSAGRDARRSCPNGYVAMAPAPAARAPRGAHPVDRPRGGERPRRGARRPRDGNRAGRGPHPRGRLPRAPVRAGRRPARGRAPDARPALAGLATPPSGGYRRRLRRRGRIGQDPLRRRTGRRLPGHEHARDVLPDGDARGRRLGAQRPAAGARDRRSRRGAGRRAPRGWRRCATPVS